MRGIQSEIVPIFAKFSHFIGCIHYLVCLTKAAVLWLAIRAPEKVKMAYTEDSIWRNRDQFLVGRDEIQDFLTKKWSKENGYRLRKELFAFFTDKVRAYPHNIHIHT